MTRLLVRLGAVSWDALPAISAASALTLVLASGHRWAVGAQPDRLKAAAFIWCPLLIVAAALWWGRDRWRPSWQSAASSPTGRDGWIQAWLLTFATAMVGLAGVGLLLLYPPAVSASRLNTWGYLDKRWLVALYLLGISLVFLPGVLYRLFQGDADVNPVSAETPAPDPHPLRTTPSRVVGRGLAAAAVGALLAVLYVVPLAPATLTKALDTHELVHLGAMQRMAQGARPYVDARTQYGPGHQFLSYVVMRSTEFTVRGFRAAHLLFNLLVTAAFFSLILFAFGWRVGAAVVIATLFVSPLQVTGFVGWGILARWFGPFMVGVMAPLVLWSHLRVSRQVQIFTSLGAVCGAFGWFAQENTATSLLALGLILAAAIACRATRPPTALILAGGFIVAELATLLALMAWLVGGSHVLEALALYRRGTGLVLAGVQNTAWSMATTQWARPAIGWRTAYYLTPYVLIGLAALTLYPLRGGRLARASVSAGQFLGMIAAAMSLNTLTLLRSDSPHFVGTTLAIAPVVVLSVAWLPGHLGIRRSAVGLRAAMAFVFVAIYPFLFVTTQFTFRGAVQPANTVAGLRALREVWQGRPPGDSGASSILVRRLGYRPDLGQSCCVANNLTFGDLEAALQGVRAAVGDRSAYVDSRGYYSAIGMVASTLYFLGDLKVGTSVPEPMMSIWVDTDKVAAQADLLSHKPECVVTGDSGFLLTDFLLGLYNHYSTHRIPGKVSLVVHCRS